MLSEECSPRGVAAQVGSFVSKLGALLQEVFRRHIRLSARLAVGGVVVAPVRVQEGVSSCAQESHLTRALTRQSSWAELWVAELCLRLRFGVGVLARVCAVFGGCDGVLRCHPLDLRGGRHHRYGFQLWYHGVCVPLCLFVCSFVSSQADMAWYILEVDVYTFARERVYRTPYVVQCVFDCLLRSSLQGADGGLAVREDRHSRVFKEDFLKMGKKRKKKKVLLSGSDPFYLLKKLRRRRYGEVSAQTSQKSQNRALVKKKVAYRAPAAQACTPPTWTINRIFSKSEILAESLVYTNIKKKNSFSLSLSLSLDRRNAVASPLISVLFIYKVTKHERLRIIL